MAEDMVVHVHVWIRPGTVLEPRWVLRRCVSEVYETAQEKEHWLGRPVFCCFGEGISAWKATLACTRSWFPSRS